LRTIHYSQLKRKVRSGDPDAPLLVRVDGTDFRRCHIGWIEDTMGSEEDRFQVVGVPRAIRRSC